jgi:hypothetical protein
MDTTPKIFVQIGDEVIELKGDEKTQFLADQTKLEQNSASRDNQLETQKELKKSAYTKLGLTQEEINAII